MHFSQQDYSLRCSTQMHPTSKSGSATLQTWADSCTSPSLVCVGILIGPPYSVGANSVLRTKSLIYQPPCKFTPQIRALWRSAGEQVHFMETSRISFCKLMHEHHENCGIKRHSWARLCFVQSLTVIISKK